MRLTEPILISKLLELTGGTLFGSKINSIKGINELNRVEEGDLVFVDHPKYFSKALESKAAVIITNQELNSDTEKSIIKTDFPFEAFQSVCKHLVTFSPSEKLVSNSAKIHEAAIIQPGAFIGNNVSIGKNTIIHSNVSIYDNVIIGDNVEIHANTVIGSDAFYYNKKENKYRKMVSIGNVVIHDDVEIGANCTIDKGVSSDTIIGKGTKIDNQVHIAHDCIIGENCLFASFVGIAGCVTIENNVTLWGQVGVISNITIGEGVVVLAQSGVGNDLEKEKKYFGSPAVEAREKMIELGALKQLPNLLKKFKS